MSVSQEEKAARFKALHEARGAFVIPNPWDAGSARMLQGMGFVALATSSGAMAGAMGRRDGKVTREEMLAHIRQIALVTDLPLSADLEKGFGSTREEVAETFLLAAQAGAVGGSIEDSVDDPDKPIHDLREAADRVAAAVEAARSLPFPFTVTARAENFLRGNPDLDDTIRRLKAYEQAGADVLFAPGLPSLAAVRAVCKAVTKPVNFMAGITSRTFSVADLEAAGVRRVSLATSLYRAAMTGLRDAALEVKERGTFGYLGQTMTTSDLNVLLKS